MLRRPSYAWANAQGIQAGEIGEERKDTQSRIGIYRTNERDDQKDASREGIKLQFKTPSL